MHITWGRAKADGREGVQVAFVHDKFVDEYQFYDKQDIDQVMNILSMPTLAPELLLMHIRDRLRLTVH